MPWYCDKRANLSVVPESLHVKHDTSCCNRIGQMVYELQARRNLSPLGPLAFWSVRLPFDTPGDIVLLSIYMPFDSWPSTSETGCCAQAMQGMGRD